VNKRSLPVLCVTAVRVSAARAEGIE